MDGEGNEKFSFYTQNIDFMMKVVEHANLNRGQQICDWLETQEIVAMTDAAARKGLL